MSTDGADKGEHILMVVGTRVLRRIFECRRKEHQNAKQSCSLYITLRPTLLE